MGLPLSAMRLPLSAMGLPLSASAGTVRVVPPREEMNEEDLEALEEEISPNCSICWSPVTSIAKISPQCIEPGHPMCYECCANFIWSEHTGQVRHLTRSHQISPHLTASPQISPHLPRSMTFANLVLVGAYRSELPNALQVHWLQRHRQPRRPVA